jgi:predicted Zn-ribbon and HTH transcriptional regulator
MLHEMKYFQQCSYCTFVFFNYRNREVHICPRCKSYIDTSSGEAADSSGGAVR